MTFFFVSKIIGEEVATGSNIIMAGAQIHPLGQIIDYGFLLIVTAQ